MLRHPDMSVVINLSHVQYKEKVDYLKTLLPMLASLRRSTGLPHRIVVDEAHYFLNESNVRELLDLDLGAYTLVTYRPSDLHADVRRAMEVICATRISDPQEAKAMQAMFGDGKGDWGATLAGLADGEAVLLPSAQEASGKLQRFSLRPRLTAHVRHRSKYLDVPMQSGHEFVFTSDGKPVGPPSRTLQEFRLVTGERLAWSAGRTCTPRRLFAMDCRRVPRSSSRIGCSQGGAAISTWIC